MLIAFDNNSKRIYPQYSGQRAFCRVCNQPVIAKCGEIYVWHWQHAADNNCDPWKEHETEWHRKWKAKFPFEWREVVIEKDGERHRADVQTADGMVIEFQNSPISTSEIRIREQFYGDLTWVVNAEAFKPNISLFSVVKSRIRDLDVHYASLHNETKNFYLKEIRDIDEKLETVERLIRMAEENHRQQRQRLERLNHNFTSIDTYVNHIVSSWGSYYVEGFWFLNLDNTLNQEKQILRDKKSVVAQLSKELEILKEQLYRIDNLPEVTIENKSFKLLSFAALPKHRPDVVRTISKASMKTMFWDVKPINSRAELLTYEYKQSEFLFAVDPTESVHFVSLQISNKEKEISSICEGLSENKLRLKSAMISSFQSEIDECIEASNRYLEQANDLKLKYANCNAVKENITQQMNQSLNESNKMHGREKYARKRSVMIKEKGLYRFHWKYERTTWRQSTQRVLFDFGEGVLFEYVDVELFRKVREEELLLELI